MCRWVELHKRYTLYAKRYYSKEEAKMSGIAKLNILIAMAIFLLAIAGTSSAGQVIYVDNDATGSNDGSSWENAYKYLQDALADADSSPKPLEVRVAQGTYRPDEGTLHPHGTGDRKMTFELIKGITIKGGYAGVDKTDQNQRDVDRNITILSGDLNRDDEPNFVNNGENSYHVVTAGSGTDATSVLDGFTISGGNSPWTGGGGIFNGDIFNPGGSPMIINCTVRWNTATGGAGMLNECNPMFGCEPPPTLINCKFIENYADIGGAFANFNRDCILIGCSFINNTGGIHGGGAIHNSGALLTLINCELIRNSAYDGGAIFNMVGDLTLINCGFFSNHGVRYGGGVFNRRGASVILRNCTLSGNYAYHGAGIYNNSASPILENCIFWNNETSGHTGYRAQIYSGTPTVRYSCIEGWTGAFGGIGNIGADPCFVNSDSNDYHLLSDSPCINAGDPGFVAGPNDTDMDGEARVMLGRVDMGADEFNPFKVEFDVVEKRRIGRTVFEYDCEVTLENISGFAVKDVRLELVKASENMTIIEPNVSFGDIEIRPGETARSVDTCSFQVDRAEAINPVRIGWDYTYYIVENGQTMERTASSLVFLEPEDIAGSINDEGKVDFEDLAELSRLWLWKGPEGGIPEDIIKDGTINLIDFAELANKWRK